MLLELHVPGSDQGLLASGALRSADGRWYVENGLAGRLLAEHPGVRIVRRPDLPAEVMRSIAKDLLAYARNPLTTDRTGRDACHGTPVPKP